MRCAAADARQTRLANLPTIRLDYGAASFRAERSRAFEVACVAAASLFRRTSLPLREAPGRARKGSRVDG
jgi:hypothetical protein